MTIPFLQCIYRVLDSRFSSTNTATMGIDVNQWRATIGLWHAFMIGRPLIRRRCCKPSGMKERKLHQTRPKNHFLSFVLLLTLLIVLSSRSNNLNKLQCRLTAAYILPPVRLVSVLLLVASEKFESIDKRRSTGTEHLSLISPNFIVPILAMLFILAGDVELNPGPFKLGKKCIRKVILSLINL